MFRKGFLSTSGTWPGRFYNDSHVRKLLQIRTLQEKGMRISEIASCRREKLQTRRHTEKCHGPLRYHARIELNISREMETKEPRKVTENDPSPKAIAKGGIENEEQ